MLITTVVTCLALASSCGEAPSAAQLQAPLSSRTLPPKSLFVSPSGSASGDGSRARPWDLPTALSQPRGVFPHDTLWLRGGTYVGDFVSRLTGEPGRRVVLRQYPGERATIDGRFDVTGSYADYWGFEIMYSDPRRVSSQPGSDPTDLPRENKVVFVRGPFNRLINLLVHDLGDGIFSGSSAEGLEIYGCIIYNNGWNAPDRGHGHNVYLQNQGATKRVVDNVLFNSFSQGLHLYGSSQASLMNLHIEGNSIFGSGDPLAPAVRSDYNVLQYGATPARHRGITYLRNSVFHRDGSAPSLKINAPGAPPGSDLVFTGNIVHGQTQFAEWNNYTVTDNLFTSGSSIVAGSDVLLALRFTTGQNPSTHRWDRNIYAKAAMGGALPFYVVGLGPSATYTFSQWKAVTAYDASGSFIGGLPQSPQVVVRPDRFDSSRALVTTWNFTGKSSVSFSPAGFLRVGDRYELRHVYDLWGSPVAQGTYTGTPLSVPQRIYVPPAPIGWGSAPPSTGLTFSVFVLERR